MPRDHRSARGRLTWGLALLLIGGFTLAKNLGVEIPRDVWQYWPILPTLVGVLQFAWPGSLHERLNGLWLIAIGIYGYVSVFRVFDLHWGTAWPILIVGIGLRIVLGGLLERDPPPPNINSSGSSGSSGGAP